MTAEFPENKNDLNQSDLDKLRAKINQFKTRKQDPDLSPDSDQNYKPDSDNTQMYLAETALLVSELNQLVEVWDSRLRSQVNKDGNKPATFIFRNRNPHHTECMSLFYSLDKDLESIGEEVELDIKCIDEVDHSAEVLPLFDLLDKELGGTSSPREAYNDTLMTPPAALSHSRLEKAIRVYTKETEDTPSKQDNQISKSEKEFEIDQQAVPGLFACLISFFIDVALATSVILIGKNRIAEISGINLYFSKLVSSLAYRIWPEDQIAAMLTGFNSAGASISTTNLFQTLGVVFTIVLTWLCLGTFFSIVIQSTVGQRIMGIVICKPEYYVAGAGKRILRVLFSLLNIISFGLRFILLARNKNSFYCRYSGTILAKRNKIVLLEEVNDEDQL